MVTYIANYVKKKHIFRLNKKVNLVYWILGNIAVYLTVLTVITEIYWVRSQLLLARLSARVWSCLTAPATSLLLLSSWLEASLMLAVIWSRLLRSSGLGFHLVSSPWCTPSPSSVLPPVLIHSWSSSASLTRSGYFFWSPSGCRCHYPGDFLKLI